MRQRLLVRSRYLVPLALALSIPLISLAWPGDPNALWHIVHDRCVPDQMEHADPAPCSEVSIASGVENGFAVLKDNSPRKPYEFLLIPTRRISGIESPLILAPDTPNYFQQAWNARFYVSGLLGVRLARDMVGLAVNSARNRTQDQLHIHVDCVRRDVRDLLAAKEGALTDRWSKLEAAGHAYMALKLPAEALARSNLFQILADGIAGARDHMDIETLAVIGASFKDGSEGFYVLSSEAGPFVPAHAEELLDPSCELARGAR
jgi:CDP-diacylglycerol pyrophosphatase